MPDVVLEDVSCVPVALEGIIKSFHPVKELGSACSWVGVEKQSKLLVDVERLGEFLNQSWQDPSP